MYYWSLYLVEHLNRVYYWSLYRAPKMCVVLESLQYKIMKRVQWRFYVQLRPGQDYLQAEGGGGGGGTVVV